MTELQATLQELADRHDIPCAGVGVAENRQIEAAAIADRHDAAVRLRVRRRYRHRVGLVGELPAVRHLLITIGSGIAYTAFTALDGHAGRDLRALPLMPIARSSVLWAHVLTSLVAKVISLVVVALLMGFRSGAGVLAWLAVAGFLVLFTLAFDMDRRHPRSHSDRSAPTSGPPSFGALASASLPTSPTVAGSSELASTGSGRV